MYNQSAIAALSDAVKSTNHFARLITLKNGIEDTRLFEFLINPSEMSFGYSGKYNPAITGSTSLPAQSYSHAEAAPIEISGLIMDTWGYKKSLRKPLNDLRALTVPATGSTSPTPVYFVWGTEKIGPCVLTDVRYTTSLFLGGEPAYCVVDLSLLEVPDPDTAPKAANPTSTKPLSNLTDRQKSEASKKASDWLKANLTRLPNPIKKVVQASQYKFLTSATGVVSIVDSKNNPIGSLGSYSGTTFKPDPKFN